MIEVPTCFPFGAFPPRSDAARADVALDGLSAAALLGGNAPNGTHVGIAILSQYEIQPNLESIGFNGGKAIVVQIDFS